MCSMNYTTALFLLSIMLSVTSVYPSWKETSIIVAKSAAFNTAFEVLYSLILGNPTQIKPEEEEERAQRYLLISKNVYLNKELLLLMASNVHTCTAIKNKGHSLKSDLC